MWTSWRNSGNRLLTWGRFVKFEHSIFSLPMFFAGAVAEGLGWPPLRNIIWMILAGVGARTLALALNRLIDRTIDARNPRTSIRELPAGMMSPVAAGGVAGAGFLVYATGAVMLGGWCLKLSWIPLLLFVLYPFMKRWTAWCHLGVGLTLGLSPLGGALAAHPYTMPGLEPYLLALFTTLWVGGFDIIYATLDEKFDRQSGLSSAVIRLGRLQALRVAAAAHTIAVLSICTLLWLRKSGVFQWGAAVAVVALFIIEHAKREEVDFAFFQVNSIVGIFILAASL